MLRRDSIVNSEEEEESLGSRNWTCGFALDLAARFVPSPSVCPQTAVLTDPVRILHDSERAFALHEPRFQVPAFPSRGVLTRVTPLHLLAVSLTINVLDVQAYPFS